MENSNSFYDANQNMNKKYLKPKIDSKIRIGGTYQAKIPKIQTNQDLVFKSPNKSVINLRTNKSEICSKIKEINNNSDN
jgi:hypothetical protein